MCKLCCNLHTLKEEIKGNDNGFPVGEVEYLDIWKNEEPLEAQIWYDKEGNMKVRDFMIVLTMNEDYLVYSIKYCPKCGRRLEVV